MMNAITHWIEEKLIAIWDFCAGALERDRLARKARPKREAEPLIVVPIPQARSKWALGLIVGALGVLLLRVGYLQVFNNDFLQNQGEIRYARTISVEGARGNILDRNGVVLASSQPSRSIWADPEFVDFNEKDKLQQVAKILEIPYKELISKIKNSSSKNFVYLSRNRDLTVGEQIRELNVPGIGISPESRRQYPDGPVMAHILGFTDRSDHGQEGVELAKDYVLSGQAGARRVIRDRRGRIVDDVWTKEAEAGQDVQLSIDSRVQFLAYSALSRQVEATKAIAGAVLVADATTGEIIALANVPTYDPNDRSTVLFERMRNRVLTDMFEPGSTMKPFAIAKGLDMGIVDPLTTIQTAPGKLTIGDRTIGDTHNYGLLTVAQVVAKSSNIGTAKIALEIPPATLYDTYSELGFGRAPNIGFPGATQLVRAYTALARNGDVIDLTLFKRSEGTEVKGTQVFKPETARRMRAMMMDTVRRGGTASNVKVDGYTVAGMTGTALKAKNGAYTKDVVASFVGIVPATQPRFIIAVMVDEPKNGRYGGRVAAPVFNEVAEGALRTLLVSPDDKESLFSQSAPTKAKN